MFNSMMTFVVETPEMYRSPRIEAFMKEQRERPDRQWVMNVLAGTPETECVKVRTDNFVILPDVEPEWPKVRQQHVGSCGRYEWSPSVYSLRRAQAGKLNWLSMVTDPGLRTLRDLRGGAWRRLMRHHLE